jgi:hypothetical protein
LVQVEVESRGGGGRREPKSTWLWEGNTEEDRGDRGEAITKEELLEFVAGSI